MPVETYEITEVTEELTEEASEEAQQLIYDLGLEGQNDLVSKEGERSPYRKMTSEEYAVYSAMCPTQTRLEEYRDESIPLRVLQVASHANQIAMFESLWVWSKENADIKDPLLVGKNGSEYGKREYFLLARWGDELEHFSKLRDMAREAIRENLIVNLTEIAAKVKVSIEAAKTAPSSAFTSGNIKTDPHFYA